MTTSDQRIGATWDAAARRLAARVNRRARAEAYARRVGLALLVAAAAALAWRALGTDVAGLTPTRAVWLLLALGLVVGLAAGRRAARRVRAVGPGDAAWALDRLAEADGRGLTAAMGRGAAASEAAWAQPALAPPPRVRLLPPGGLVLGVAALLLGALAVLANEGAAETATVRTPTTATGGMGSAAAGGTADPTARARTADARAEALDGRADEARRMRAALNLPAEGPLDPREIAAGLADPMRRREAEKAASGGTALSALLGDAEASAEALARLLDRGAAERAEAARGRREAAAARAQTTLLPIPPGRRVVVTHYLQLIE